MPDTPAVSVSTSSLRAFFLRLQRPQIVWLSLLASMTVGAGTLLAMGGGGIRQQADGLALAASVPAAGAQTLEGIFATPAPLDTQRWRSIVIHHSGSAFGSAHTIAAEHEARGLQGLGFQFVIGNGQGAADGELFVGRRWLQQLPGAHTAGPNADEYNQHAIGICLVGDGDRRPFTAAQLARLSELVTALSRQFDIPESQVVLHRDVAPTTSPGRLFPEAALRDRLSRANP